jgi:molecular chaperone GrpE
MNAKQNTSTQEDVEPIAGAVPEGDELAALRNELSDVTNRLLRTTADHENYRKRWVRDLEDERRYAESSLLKDLLPVYDNAARAIEAAEKIKDAAGLLEGFKLLKQQLEGVFERHYCVPIAAKGQPFDPNKHAAISMQPSADQPDNTVLMDVQTGFQHHDRVLRPSQVIIATKG